MEEIRIPWADWKIEERIGKGGFGMVYKIRHRDEFNVEEYAAMKIIRFPQDDHENAVLLSEGYDIISSTRSYCVRIVCICFLISERENTGDISTLSSP